MCSPSCKPLEAMAVAEHRRGTHKIGNHIHTSSAETLVNADGSIKRTHACNGCSPPK